jgi:hypothetical protein
LLRRLSQNHEGSSEFLPATREAPRNPSSSLPRALPHAELAVGVVATHVRGDTTQFRLELGTKTTTLGESIVWFATAVSRRFCCALDCVRANGTAGFSLGIGGGSPSVVVVG